MQIITVYSHLIYFELIERKKETLIVAALFSELNPFLRIAVASDNQWKFPFDYKE